MATVPRSEYVGFAVTDSTRTYTLRVTGADGDSREYKVSIANQAFLSHRVLYQDAPQICFLKLERELLAHGEEKTATEMKVSDRELDEYRESHTKKPSQHRPRPQIKP